MHSNPSTCSRSSAAAQSPVRLSAQGLHELAIQAFRTGNRGRLSLCEALRVLHETRLFYDLGFPSLAAYADAFFQLRRSETYEHVRVAKSLVDLTELREAFGQGRIGWTALKGITRVASVDSQTDWLDFVRQNGIERTLAEARDALRNRRDTPRDGSFGLPNLDQKLVLRFSRSDMDKVRTWLAAGCARVAEQTAATEVSPEQAVLFLCEQDAAHAMGRGRSVAEPRGSSDEPCRDARRDTARARIVYQCCPDCRRSRVGTRDGFVEVSSEEISRYEGSAEQVAIDGPTPAGLRRRVLAREAGRCGNPRCGHLAEHCHHIVFRSRGGKTDLANEVAVCTTCHALIHAGLLRVYGNAQDELRWSPAGCNDSLQGEVSSERAVAERLPVLRLLTGAARRDPVPDGAEESANADSVLDRINPQDLAHGLVRLGIPAARSRQLIDAAIAELPLAELTEANVLQAAIRSI